MSLKARFERVDIDGAFNNGEVINVSPVLKGNTINVDEREVSRSLLHIRDGYNEVHKVFCLLPFQAASSLLARSKGMDNKIVVQNDESYEVTRGALPSHEAWVRYMKSEYRRKKLLGVSPLT